MSDKEYIEMSRLLESITQRANTLRYLFPGKGKLTDEIKSHPQFIARWGLLTLVENEIKELVGLLKGCDDWTSDKIKASEIYRMMRELVSITYKMPIGIGLFGTVQPLCEKRMEVITQQYPDLYPYIVRKILESKKYQDLVDRGKILKPFTWTGNNLKELADFILSIDDLHSPNRVIGSEDGFFNDPDDKDNTPQEYRNWKLVDRVFRWKGKLVTADQLSNASRR